MTDDLTAIDGIGPKRAEVLVAGVDAGLHRLQVRSGVDDGAEAPVQNGPLFLVE
jgi:hypothetical protein